MNVEAVIADRLGRWGNLLREQSATPIVLIGVTSNDFVICTLEEMTDQKIRDVLASCINIIAEGRRSDV